MDTRPVFMLVTAEGCGGCSIFKSKVLENLKNELENQGKVKFVHINVPVKPYFQLPQSQRKNILDLSNYHGGIGSFVGWFPTMSLFPASDWNDLSSKLRGVIKNGKIMKFTDENGNSKDIVDMVGNANAMSKDDIINWVNDTLENNILFRNPQKSKKKNIILLNNGKEINMKETKIKVPTYYSKFKSSDVN